MAAVKRARKRAVRRRLDAGQRIGESAFARHAVDGDRQRFVRTAGGQRLQPRRDGLDECEVLAPALDTRFGARDRGAELPDEPGR